MSSIDFGMDRQNFFDEHYDKHWLLQRQAFQANKFSWSDLDHALYSWDPSKRLKLIKSGKVELEKFTEPYMDLSEQRTRIIKDVLYQYMKDGATLILNKVQLHSAVVHDYCMTIAQFVGEKANANAYAAFGGDNALGKHWDTHDVFALQLIGRKRWKLFQPTFEKPLGHQKSIHHRAECPEEPALDIVLEAGDLLYVPRGWWHEAIPIENEPTFHLAIGLFPPRIIDYLVWICLEQLPAYSEGRQSLNPYLDTTRSVQAIFERLGFLLNDNETYQQYLQSFDSQQRVHSRFGIAQLAKQYEKNSMSKPEHSIARINRFSPINSSKEQLLVNGIKLNLDEQSRGFLENLVEKKSISVDELYTATEQELLHRLGEYDVVEWIER